MRTRSQIILLNGVGSVGESAIARALQAVARRPMMHVEMDAFLAMAPAALLDHPDGMVFERGVENGAPSIAIRTGPVVDRLLGGMRRAAAAMADLGLDMIVDEALMTPEDMADYEALLAAHALIRVGVFAPLDVLEARERQRGDREIGLARWQFPRVHRGMRYDLEIDASAASPEECAEAIRARYDL